MSELPQSILSIKLSELERPSKLVVVHENTKLHDVVDALIGNAISACPVIRNGTRSNLVTDMVGFVDLLDIVEFFLASQQANAGFGKGFEAVFETLVQFDSPLSKVITENKSVLSFTLPETATIQDALNELGPKHNTRVVITDANGAIVNILTPTSLLRFIYDKLTHSPQAFREAELLLSQQLAELVVRPRNSTTSIGLTDPHRAIVKIKSSQQAVDAFKLIREHHVSGVAVVDDHGNLIGNISLRDIRAMVGRVESFDNLFSRIDKFLEAIKTERVKAAAKVVQDPTTVSLHDILSDSTYENVYTLSTAHAELPPIITISAQDTLGYVISILVQHHVRRLYITSGKLSVGGQVSHIPSGVVSVSDLIAVCAGHL